MHVDEEGRQVAAGRHRRHALYDVGHRLGLQRVERKEQRAHQRAGDQTLARWARRVAAARPGKLERREQQRVDGDRVQCVYCGVEGVVARDLESAEIEVDAQRKHRDGSQGRTAEDALADRVGPQLVPMHAGVVDEVLEVVEHELGVERVGIGQQRARCECRSAQDVGDTRAFEHAAHARDLRVAEGIATRAAVGHVVGGGAVCDARNVHRPGRRRG